MSKKKACSLLTVFFLLTIMPIVRMLVTSYDGFSLGLLLFTTLVAFEAFAFIYCADDQKPTKIFGFKFSIGELFALFIIILALTLSLGLFAWATYIEYYV